MATEGRQFSNPPVGSGRCCCPIRRRPTKRGRRHERHPPCIASGSRPGVGSGVGATYNRYTYFNEKREALELWANELTKIVTKPSEPNVAKKSG